MLAPPTTTMITYRKDWSGVATCELTITKRWAPSQPAMPTMPADRAKAETL